MAAFTIQNRHPAIFRITDDIASTHDVTNSTSTTFFAGVIVNVTKGDYQVQELDGDTLVEVKAGATVTIDPTAVPQAVGVGFSDKSAQMVSTTYEFVVQ
jgi:hypothetical protein